MVEIDLNQASQDVLSFIIGKMSSGICRKRSESNNIIVLANFTRKKKNINEPRKYGGDIVTQLARLLERSGASISDISYNGKFLNRRIKKIIQKKMKKAFYNHLEHIRMAIGEFQSVQVLNYRELRGVKLNKRNCLPMNPNIQTW